MSAAACWWYRSSPWRRTLRGGNRPGFGYAAEPERARALYEHYVEACRQRWPHVATGVFGADMKVSLVNDGPVTILLEG